VIRLKCTLILFLLLFCLSFNIAHATVIAIEDDCHHESVHEYIQEQSHDTQCGDLCDMHHLFHFMAIVDTTMLQLSSIHIQEKLTHKNTYYTPPYQETTIKPPIA